MPCTVLKDLTQANKFPRSQKIKNAWLCFPAVEVRAGTTPLRLMPGDALACFGEKNWMTEGISSHRRGAPSVMKLLLCPWDYIRII